MATRIVRQQESASSKISAAIYARVSTLNGNQDPSMQTRELKEYCERRGWHVFDCYIDNGVSGKKDSRPQLNRMMRDAHERRFDVVVVWRFDRFARSVSHLLRALETFNSLGVQFVSLSEQVDTSTPTGKMIFTVLGAVAELERNLIVERVRAGLRHARAKGKRLGRPRKSVDAAEVRSLRAAGESWRTIARKTGVSVGTVFAAAQDRRDTICAHRLQEPELPSNHDRSVKEKVRCPLP
jgi:DNA invertase Pin-like site-specific DNA recombinase